MNKSIDLLTALDLLGKAEARVAELEAAAHRVALRLTERQTTRDTALAEILGAALAAVRQEGT